MWVCVYRPRLRTAFMRGLWRVWNATGSVAMWCVRWGGWVSTSGTSAAFRILELGRLQIALENIFAKLAESRFWLPSVSLRFFDVYKVGYLLLDRYTCYNINIYLTNYNETLLCVCVTLLAVRTCVGRDDLITIKRNI